MCCHECKESLIDVSKRVFICRTCSPDLSAGDAVYFCMKCNASSKHEHKREKLKGGAGNPFVTNEKDKDKMTDE